MFFYKDIDNLIIKLNELLADAQYDLEVRRTHLRNSSRYMAPEYKKKIDDIESELTYSIQHYEYTLALLLNIRNGHALLSNDFYYLETISFIKDFLDQYRENIFIELSPRRNTI